MDDRNIYKCYNQPRHLSVSMDKFGFRYLWSLLTVVSCRDLMLYSQPLPEYISMDNKYTGWYGTNMVCLDMVSRYSLNWHGILCRLYVQVYALRWYVCMDISVQDCITVFTWDLHVIKGHFGTVCCSSVWILESQVPFQVLVTSSVFSEKTRGLIYKTQNEHIICISNFPRTYQDL